MDPGTGESTVRLRLSGFQERTAASKGAENRKLAGVGWGTQGTEMFCLMIKRDPILF